jgi:hypothetical protein
MVVAEVNGLPIGLYVDSARPHESQLTEATLATVSGGLKPAPGRPGRARFCCLVDALMVRNSRG